MELCCKRCGSAEHVKIGLMRGKQRYLCKACGLTFTDRRDVALPEKKSQPLWIWKAWDRATGQLVDWECGGRDKATCERLIERLKCWRTRLYCTDDYAAYDVLPVGQRYSGKNETQGIERATPGSDTG